MLPFKSNCSYSDFFTSGFRAMTNRSRCQVSAVSAPSSSTATDSTSTTRRTTRRHSFGGLICRRSRTTSPVAPLSEAIITPSPSSPSSRRRSSIATFSSWLFDRKGSKSPHSDSSLSHNTSPKIKHCEILGTAEKIEIDITADGPFTQTNTFNSSQEDSAPDPIDPFSLSPDSKFLFVELTESVLTSRHIYKPEPFLSFSTSSPDRSFLHLPTTRRERPTSVQSMPLPSRRSSYQYYHRSPSRDRSSCYVWTVEEDSRIATPEPVVEHLEERLDPMHHMDWRQFHLEVLLDEA
ncbi:hypothetical protein H0H81_004388 [Sphagnurus paluster]|uniref:Uncharacterized protein n=1 Tax=Sphagnurus paluster TaxID=117069 RepID=A0A9P7KMI1_9AGAR|nr:hypothetical protein H0H81_004388 [Sphagnurus paluster]